MKSIHLILWIILAAVMIISCADKQTQVQKKPEKQIPGPVTTVINQQNYDKILYVSADSGSDETGDGSQQNPWSSINYALSQTRDASSERSIAILVSTGSYSKATIHMKDHVDLYGGFSSESWQRDINRYITIEYLNVDVSAILSKFLGPSLEITFYQIPFVWDPQIYLNGELLAADKYQDYKRNIIRRRK